MSKSYASGFEPSYWAWLGKYKNQQYDYFARHKFGRPIDYSFNSQGYRGYEHHPEPDISVFGSSFSFGVGIDWESCWHQNLGNYKVNCYAPAGIPVTNNDIIEHSQQQDIKSGIVILQLREFSYNTAPINLPNGVHVFIIDSYRHQDIFGFDWASFVDKAEDHTHPGKQTHWQWAQQIKKQFNL